MRELPELPMGSAVWVPDMKVPATVIESAGTPRSYKVSSPKGTMRRNRAFLTNYSPDDTQDPEDKVGAETKAVADPVPEVKTPPAMTTTRSGRVVKPPDWVELVYFNLV